MRVPTRAGWITVAAWAVALAAGGAQVVTATEVGQTGLVGSHSLRDTADKPGARCIYKAKGVNNVPFSLAQIKVRPPMVFARDLGGGVDRQKTGWRFFIQKRKFSETTWKTVFTSQRQQAMAADNSAAPFTSMTGSPPLPQTPAAYRVLIKMFWYRSGATEGTASATVDFYFIDSPDGTDVAGPPNSFCADGRGN